MAWRLSKPKPKCSLVIAFAVGYSYIEGVVSWCWRTLLALPKESSSRGETLCKLGGFKSASSNAAFPPQSFPLQKKPLACGGYGKLRYRWYTPKRQDKLLF